IHLDRPETETEIASRDPAVGLKLRRDPLERGGRNDQNASTRAEDRHADGAPDRVEDKPALGAPSKRYVEFDARIDLAAAQTAPGCAGPSDDAERRRRRAVGSADHERKRSDGGFGDLKRRGRQVLSIRSQQGNVGGGVAPDELRWYAIAARK